LFAVLRAGTESLTPRVVVRGVDEPLKGGGVLERVTEGFQKRSRDDGRDGGRRLIDEGRGYGDEEGMVEDGRESGKGWRHRRTEDVQMTN